MKQTILMSLFGLLLSTTISCAQESEISKVKKTIYEFSKAGDAYDVKALERCLDDNYRVVMNRLFGSQEVNVVPRAVYIEKIKSKEWGGDERKVTIDNLILNGNTASAKVILAGSKTTFVSLIDLVKDGKGQWKLVSDMPLIK